MKRRRRLKQTNHFLHATTTQNCEQCTNGFVVVVFFFLYFVATHIPLPIATFATQNRQKRHLSPTDSNPKSPFVSSALSLARLWPREKFIQLFELLRSFSAEKRRKVVANDASAISFARELERTYALEVCQTDGRTAERTRAHRYSYALHRVCLRVRERELEADNKTTEPM